MSTKTYSSSWLRAIIIASVLLACILIGSFFLGTKLVSKYPENISDIIRLAITFIGTWLMITATNRSLVKHHKDIQGYWLLLASIFIPFVGYMIYYAFLYITKMIEPAKIEGVNLRFGVPLFYTAGGFVIGLLQLINLKVRNNAFGNILELLVVLALLYIMYMVMIR